MSHAEQRGAAWRCHVAAGVVVSAPVIGQAMLAVLLVPDWHAGSNPLCFPP